MSSLHLTFCLVGAVIGFAFGFRTSSPEWRLLGTLGNLVKLILGFNLTGIAHTAADSLIGKAAVTLAGGFLIGHALGSLTGSFFSKTDTAKPISTNENEHQP